MRAMPAVLHVLEINGHCAPLREPRSLGNAPGAQEIGLIEA
jgi:hypothetical protein